MKKRIHIKPISLAKLQAVLFGLLGLLAGIIYAVGGLIIDVSVSAGWAASVAAETPGLSIGTLLAFGAIVGMPGIGLIVGFVTGFVEAVCFNTWTKIFGKVRVGLD